MDLEFRPSFQKPRREVDSQSVGTESRLRDKPDLYNPAGEGISSNEAALLKQDLIEMIDDDIQKLNEYMEEVRSITADFSIFVPDEQTLVVNAIKRLDPKNTVTLRSDGTINEDLSLYQNTNNIDIGLYTHALEILHPSGSENVLI